MKIKDLNPNVSISNDGQIRDNSKELTPEFVSYHNKYELESPENYKFIERAWRKEFAKDYLTIPSISSFINVPESVCQADDRTNIKNTSDFPWKMICKLYGTMSDGNRYVASGFFIGPRCIITNGHVVFPNGNWATEIEVIPGMDGNIAPFGSDLSTNFRCVTGWTQDEQMEFDYGAIILNDNTLYDKVGAYFGYEQFNGLPILNNAGYPADKTEGTMWYDAGKVVESTERMFKYMFDTSGGNSGSPTWGNNKRVAGVHGYGGCPNEAVKVIADVMKNWNYWKTL
ncbi:MAG: trypsin-like serine protease [Maribacter sp.]|uniref:trypsin-like serine peptidase n=1 Tax=Maribacter sp. TaxID=1897614 RepID=UPI003299AEA6